jgi:hypothetical protein
LLALAVQLLGRALFPLLAGLAAALPLPLVMAGLAALATIRVGLVET